MKFFIGVIIVLAVSALIYFFNSAAMFEKVKLSGLQTKRDSANPLRNSKVVVTSFQMGIGRDKSLGLVLASPYKDIKQQSQLCKYETRIKSDFIMQIDEEKLNEWVKKRNFREIKSTFRGIVNKYLDEPVNEVYLSSFFYE